MFNPPLRDLCGPCCRRTALHVAAGIVLLAAVLRLWLTPVVIPTGSMSPTLEPDALVVLNRLAYAGSGSGPARGDIVVFTKPRAPQTWLIKRVVAVAGDRLDVDEYARLRVNGQALAYAATDRPRAFRESDPRQPDGPVHTVLLARKPGPATSYVVAPGTVFVMGDNRGQSHDSRAFGAIPLEHVVGRSSEAVLTRR